jgi:hypothetical protein
LEIFNNRLGTHRFFHETLWFVDVFEITRTGVFRVPIFFQIPETSGSLVLNFFSNTLEPVVFLVLIFFQIPRTDSYLKNQRTTPGW